MRKIKKIIAVVASSIVILLTSTIIIVCVLISQKEADNGADSGSVKFNDADKKVADNDRDYSDQQVYGESYPIAEQMNQLESIEEFLDDRYEIKQIYLRDGEFVDADEQIWANISFVDEQDGEEDFIILFNPKGKIIGKYQVDTERYDLWNSKAVGNYFVLKEKDSDVTFLYDERWNDITGNILKGEEILIDGVRDASGLNFITRSYVENFSDKDYIYRIVDINGNEKFSFSKNELLSDKSDYWYWDAPVFNEVGNNTYIPNPKGGVMWDKALIIDTARKKAFIQDVPQHNGGVISSDGNNILYYQTLHYGIFINLDG